jgi:hypothetical protein
VIEGVVVRIEHCRQLRYCARGIRILFERYELDYPDFLQNGIDAQKLLTATGNDGMVQAAVEVARGQQQ